MADIRDSAKYGRRPHTGLDLDLRVGESVIAVVPGRACANHDKLFEETGGNSIWLFPRITPEGGLENAIQWVEKLKFGEERTTLAVRYLHLSRTVIPEGECEFVRVGDKLGEVGNTGYSAGPHLHFDIVPSQNWKRIEEGPMEGAINPLFVMRREPGQPLGTITCYEPGMTYRPNAGDPPNQINIVWPTRKC